MRAPGSFYPPVRTNHDGGAGPQSYGPGGTPQQGLPGVFMGCAGIPTAMSPMPQAHMMGTVPPSLGSFGNQPTTNVSQLHTGFNAGMNVPQGNATASSPRPSMTGFGVQSVPSSPMRANAMHPAVQGINVAPMAAPTGSGQCGCTGCPQVTAFSVLHNLDNSALPQPAPYVQSAFEMLGKTPVAGPTHERVDKDDVMMKALLAAISGDKKMLPPWNGSVETLRAWLRQLSLWELDNNLPKSRWGLKLMQSFHEGTAPRRIAEAIDLATLTSESGYSAILSSLMAKYAPYLEASGPAAVENFFYGNERSKNESFSTYIAAKEIALQEMESHLGEKLPPRIAGRILLRHAGLNDLQRENLAVKYNALLTFDQAAAALRPLDRPEALMSRVAKTYVSSTQVDGELDDEQTNEDDDELQLDEDELSGPESDGHGNFTYMLFDPEQEYDEDEANFVWAYNSAYKDVRKELQARRKGRQFYKPKAGVAKKGKNKGNQNSGKGKGTSSSSRGQGRGHGSHGHRGTPEELMSRTRCFSCGQLGHISKECPKRAQESSANFFVCQGSSGNQNKVYVNISEAKEKKFSVYAGVQTSGNEAVVDTAAEEAVIGSAAMAKLRQCLESYGLKPAPAHGATVTCAGIGGSAKILGIYDVPVGVARTNGLIRVTEISDEGSFCTPFLLPISYIELVGATVDVSKELFTLKNGNSTPMRRSPSGHRTISVLEFAGKWTLPQQLLDELKMEGENPFQAASPKPSPAKISTSTKFAQRPGVAVWLKTAQHQLQYMSTLSPRKTLVHPKEVFPSSLLGTLDKSRWTVIDSNDEYSAPLSIHDSWLINQQRQLPFWSGDVFFQQFSQFSPSSIGTVVDVAAPFHLHSPGDPSQQCERDALLHDEASMRQPAMQPTPMQVQDQRGLERTADVSTKMSTVSSDVAVQKHVSFSDDVQFVHSSSTTSHMLSSPLPQPSHAFSSRSLQQPALDIATTESRPSASTQGTQDPVEPQSQPGEFWTGNAEACDAMAAGSERRHARPSAEEEVSARKAYAGLASHGAGHDPTVPGGDAAVGDRLPYQQKLRSHGEAPKGQEGQVPGLSTFEEDRKGQTWHRAAFASLQGMQRLAKRTLGLCSRRKSAEAARVKGQLLVDLPSVWKSMATCGVGARSGDQRWSGLFRGIPRFSRNREDPDLLQGGIPKQTATTEVKAKPDNLDRRGGDGDWHRSPDGTRRENDTSTHAVRRTTPDAAGAPTEPPSSSSHGNSTNNRSGDRHGGSGTDEWDGLRPNRPNSRSAVGEVDGRAQEGAPQTDADGKWSSTCPTKVKVSRISIIGAGNPRDPYVGRRDDSTQSHPRLSNGDAMRNQVCKPQEYEGKGGCKTNSIAKPLAQATKLAMFATVLVCSQLPDAEQRISTLLGPRMEFEDGYSTEGDLGIKEMTFSLNASTSELARADFDGVPKTIDKQQRQQVSFALRNYLDHIGEIYSPPRATAMSPGEGLRGKIALDLTNGWDFCKSEHRQKAVKLVKTHKPAVLLLSPPCGPFSSLRNLSNSKRDSEQVRREVIEGELHMNFAISLAMLQVSEGRGFILEQPKNAKSWKLPKMLELLDHPDVYQIRVDMCQFGLRAQAGPCKGELVQKPTLLATNIAEMAHYVQKTCSKSHQHGMLVGGSAKMAAIYTPHFVKALLHGIKNALGIKAAKPQNPQLHQAFLYGKSIGIQAQIFAVDCQEVNVDFAMASNSHPRSLDFQAVGLRQVVGFGLAPPARPNAEASGFQPSNGLSRMVWPAAADDEDLPEAVVPEVVDDEVLEETRRQLRNVGERATWSFQSPCEDGGLQKGG